MCLSACSARPAFSPHRVQVEALQLSPPNCSPAAVLVKGMGRFIGHLAYRLAVGLALAITSLLWSILGLSLACLCPCLACPWPVFGPAWSVFDPTWPIYDLFMALLGLSLASLLPCLACLCLSLALLGLSLGRLEPVFGLLQLGLDSLWPGRGWPEPGLPGLKPRDPSHRHHRSGTEKRRFTRAHTQAHHHRIQYNTDLHYNPTNVSYFTLSMGIMGVMCNVGTYRQHQHGTRRSWHAIST